MAGTLIYDGGCRICRASVTWVQDHLRPGADVTFLANQDIDVSDYGLTRADVDGAAWWVDPDGTTHRGHAAVAKALLECNGAWPALGFVLPIWPLSVAASALYEWVADNRSKLGDTRRPQPS